MTSVAHSRILDAAAKAELPMHKAILANLALVTIAILSPAACAPARAQASDTRTPEEVVKHHLDAFTRHDLDAVLSDYADDAIFLAPKQAVQGKPALRKMFESFFVNRGDSKAPAPVFEAKVTADGDVGYEHWVMNPGKPGSIEGTDAFVVRHGKIVFHTVLSTGPASTKP
ncbi:MAG TPA: nuclear transport factor 2 family protein [Candidatus Acidoferrales bacterium]|nr:nuclear transport factor 2 family protein [Candidatus Acidoferrales bacterium]